MLKPYDGAPPHTKIKLRYPTKWKSTGRSHQQNIPSTLTIKELNQTELEWSRVCGSYKISGQTGHAILPVLAALRKHASRLLNHASIGKDIYRQFSNQVYTKPREIDCSECHSLMAFVASAKTNPLTPPHECEHSTWRTKLTLQAIADELTFKWCLLRNDPLCVTDVRQL